MNKGGGFYDYLLFDLVELGVLERYTLKLRLAYQPYMKPQRKIRAPVLKKNKRPLSSQKKRERYKAYNTVRLSLLSGKLKRKDGCEECGKDGLLHAHHKNYQEPLDVLWLCPKCHKAEHRK